MPQHGVTSTGHAVPGSHLVKFWQRLFRLGPDRELVARVDKLRKDLAKVKIDIETRRFLVELVFANGRFCHSCSPLQRVGACGRTCALLRPKTGSSIFPGMSQAMTNAWMSETISVGRSYDEIAGQAAMSGYSVSPSSLQRWEEVVARLQARLG